MNDSPVSPRRPTLLPRTTDLLITFVALLLDQVTKLWAMARFDGIPRGETISVIGDYWRFQLAFNEGAAFSMRPQDIAPWIPQTLFYLLLGSVAIVALLWFYRSTSEKDRLSRWGIMLILSGAMGNLIDRIRIGKVIDFIDWDFPDLQIGVWVLERWPTFNLADSSVLIGVALLLLSPLFLKKKEQKAK